jgi:precorrin-6A/cobalt-precorrin-6A reductase
MKLLVFAGTTEGRELAEAAARLGWDVTASVATEYGAGFFAPAGHLQVREGRLDEGQMEKLLAEGDFALVVDATHPYAVEVSRNLRAAAKAAGAPYLRLLRPESEAPSCLFFDTLPEAARAAGARPGNILAATGANQIAAYAEIPDFAARVYARVLPTEESRARCLAAGLPEEHIIAAMGPFGVEQNVRDLSAHKIASLVTKDGGAAGGFPEKLEAAGRCGAAVFVVRRPRDEGLSYDEVLEIIRRKRA